MSKPAFLAPGSVVKTTFAIHPQERGHIGFVRRTDNDPERQVKVTLLDGPFAGSSLLYNVESLTPAG